VTTLPAGFDDDFEPQFSPDGSSIVFTRFKSARKSAIHRVGVDGTGLERLTKWKLNASDPDWSPNGKKITFDSGDFGGETNGGGNIHVMRADGSGRKKLTDHPRVRKGDGEPFKVANNPVWSPSGTRIMFTRFLPERTKLVAMRPNGSHKHVVLDQPRFTNKVDWALTPSSHGSSRRGFQAREDQLHDAFCELFLVRHGATVTERTRKTLAERLKPSREAFGDWTLAELEGAADDIARWRAGLTDTSRYRLTLAFRQALGAAVRWRYMTRNPAIEAGRNPEPRAEELLPFVPGEINAIEVELGPMFGPIVVFAAETGLRTNEWIALERRDLDRSGLAVLVQRRYAGGTLTPYPKTPGSRRRVPMSARALAALDRLPPRLDTKLVFPAARGGYIGLDGWRTRHWYPALEAAGIRQRGPYQLRHTFATEALAAGLSIFELARVMGTSVKMIDRTYGHLARDSEQAIRARLNARTGRSGDEVATGVE
jgi:integrase